MCISRKKRRIVVINMPHLTKDQVVWVFLEYARVNNTQDVIRQWADRAPTEECCKNIPKVCERGHLPLPEKVVVQLNELLKELQEPQKI